MKKGTIAVLIVGLAAAIVALVQVPGIGRLVESDKALRARDLRAWLEKRHRRAEAAMKPGSLVLLGDSMSLGFITIETRIRDLVNLGIGGEDSVRLKLRLSDYKGLDKARAIFVQVGVNDLFQGRSVHDTASSVDDLLKSLTGKPLFLSAVFPVDELKLTHPTLVSATNAKIDELNDLIRSSCEKLSRCRFVPVSRYRNREGLAPEFDIGDGIHLNQVGYRAWEDIIVDAVDGPRARTN